MNKTNIFAVGILSFVVILGFAQGWFTDSSRQIESSTWKQVDQQKIIDVMNNPGTVIVDLREDYLYNKEHIPNAINIPFTEIESRFKELDKEKEIIFVCHAGPMGEASSELLIKNGFKNVSNLKGGMEKWTGPTTF